MLVEYKEVGGMAKSVVVREALPQRFMYLGTQPDFRSSRQGLPNDKTMLRISYNDSLLQMQHGNPSRAMHPTIGL